MRWKGLGNMVGREGVGLEGVWTEVGEDGLRLEVGSGTWGSVNAGVCPGVLGGMM